jgi:TRAP-type C4-dicarboxylate transport system permease small subunit
MKRFETLAAAAFGIVFLVLAVAVAVETASRKLFNVSLQGVDELGGYCLAIGGALSFAVALVSRAHIRIDIAHERFPKPVRIVLNVLAVAALFVSALALMVMSWISLSDSILFGSTAQTPWATPLRYPQTLWVAALGVFVTVALLQLVRVGLLVARRRLDQLDREFSPRGSREELEEELEDIRHRGTAAIDLEKGLQA